MCTEFSYAHGQQNATAELLHVIIGRTMKNVQTTQWVSQQCGRFSGSSHKGIEGREVNHSDGSAYAIGGPCQYKLKRANADGIRPRDAQSAGLDCDSFNYNRATTIGFEILGLTHTVL